MRAAGLCTRFCQQIIDLTMCKRESSPFEHGVRHGHLGASRLARLDGDHEGGGRVEMRLDRLGQVFREDTLVLLLDRARERREGLKGRGRVHHERSLARRVAREDVGHRVEHVLVRLVVTGAQAELGIRVLVQQAANDFALVGVGRSDLDVLLALLTGMT